MKVTRSILEVLAAHDHPVSIVTKSALVTRDLDILAPMAAKGLASVGVSVTTLDADLATAMEPRLAPRTAAGDHPHAFGRGGSPSPSWWRRSFRRSTIMNWKRS